MRCAADGGGSRRSMRILMVQVPGGGVMKGGREVPKSMNQGQFPTHAAVPGGWWRRSRRACCGWGRELGLGGWVGGGEEGAEVGMRGGGERGGGRCREMAGGRGKGAHRVRWQCSERMEARVTGCSIRC